MLNNSKRGSKFHRSCACEISNVCMKREGAVEMNTQVSNTADVAHIRDAKEHV